MQARKLRRILNDTKYTVGNYGEYIAIGSPLCHDLIKINKSDYGFKLALDTFNKGRASIGNKELTFIYDKLKELAESGELREIIDQDDELENPLHVFTVTDGKLVSTFTDEYGWPNTTVDGTIMHDNNYFKTAKQAIKYGIREAEASIEMCSRTLSEIEEKANTFKAYIQKYKDNLAHLKSL
jgi:hypothetical protein